MRDHPQVHDQEYTLHDEQCLITRTDARGRIIYANPAFLEVSGYTQADLMGKGHDTMRHPDMPLAAYDDLWRTIQRGKSWTGVIKNRRKHGGHYWSLASITPVMERGVTVCYACVRVKPTRAQIETADSAYRRLRTGITGGLRLSAGRILPGGLLARLRDWRAAGVRTRMLTWAGLSSALFLAAGGFALHGMAANLDGEQLALAAAVLAGGSSLIFASGWAYARTLSGLLATATDFTRQIAAGNLGTPLAPGNPDDETGALRFSLEATRRNLVGLARDVHSGIADAPETAAERGVQPAGTEDLRHAIEVFRLARTQPLPARQAS
ncbi:methyl-accepting chemotaxis protein [Achromobacter sp. SD115]|uniref:methyl-accepting chemotaxis protein n=1 Tax=Achromobacter sp. SD115 TaxID=2782011 RepID=UPI001A968C76|nr:PAS domain-containing protein [Achromobacter sp. SD115]MBO1014298.1 methyl-accepting chemotaxis protein [Achromobacter sp. SD115]